MKHLFVLIVMLAVGFGLPNAAPTATAQDDGPRTLSYGDEVRGRISNREFEQLYLFEGAQDDIVIIRMDVLEGDFDAYLFLTTLDNDIVAQNDSFGFYNNATIIFTLPSTATYQIVATRYSGRSGYGDGQFALGLDIAESVELGAAIEGTAAYGETPPFHLFYPTTSTYYTITYTHIVGPYFPDVGISQIDPLYGYGNDSAVMGGAELRSASVTVFLVEGFLYNLGVRESYYNYDVNIGDSAMYVLTITAAEEKPSSPADTDEEEEPSSEDSDE